MALKDYRSDTMLSINILADIYCTFTVYELCPEITQEGHVRVFIDIEHDKVFNHLDYQSSMDLTYTRKEYELLIAADKLVENIKIHYLQSESLTRGLDEYFH